MMEPLDRLQPGDIMRVQVKNTFLEVESDSDDSLDIGGFARASTEPAKTVQRKLAKHLGEEPAQLPYTGSAQMPYYSPGALTTSWGTAPPQAQYPPQQEPPPANGWVQSGVRALESDPDLAPVFESIRRGGMDAALRLCRDEDLMRTISHKMGSLNTQLGGTQLGGNAAPPILGTDPNVNRLPLNLSSEGCTSMGVEQGMSGGMQFGSPMNAPMGGCVAPEPGPMAGFPAGPGLGAGVPAGPSPTGAVDPAVIQEALAKTIHKTTCSVTVSDPSLDDCPLISCSEGFEALTGYTRNEVLGKNCRFLNCGVAMDPNMRQALRIAVQRGTDFIGVLQNRKKNGEPFSNLLRLTSMTLGGKRYIIGVQADVTNVSINLADAAHMEGVWNLVKTILPTNLEAYIQMQAREFFLRQPPSAPPQMLQDPSKPYEAKPGRKNKKSDSMGTKVGSPDHFFRGVSNTSDESTAVPSQADGTGTDPGEFGVAPRMPGLQPLEAPPGEPGVLKSVGSKGHPDQCHSECIFYFFRNGCNAGADCRFCHEFHWRKNMKKNRRILKRLAGQPGINEDGGASPSEIAD